MFFSHKNLSNQSSRMNYGMSPSNQQVASQQMERVFSTGGQTFAGPFEGGMPPLSGAT